MEQLKPHSIEPLYSGHHWGVKFCPLIYRGVALSQELICTERVHLGGLYKGCPHIRVAFMRGSTVLWDYKRSINLLFKHVYTSFKGF